MTDEKNVDIIHVDGLISEIGEKEPEMARAIKMVVEHIHGTYSDKYAKGQEEGIDTKQMLYGRHGAAINSYQVQRYLQRYNTHGSRKSGLIVDLFKAVHYLCFEITRRIRNNDFVINEPKV